MKVAFLFLVQQWRMVGLGLSIVDNLYFFPNVLRGMVPLFRRYHRHRRHHFGGSDIRPVIVTTVDVELAFRGWDFHRLAFFCLMVNEQLIHLSISRKALRILGWNYSEQSRLRWGAGNKRRSRSGWTIGNRSGWMAWAKAFLCGRKCHLAFHISMQILHNVQNVVKPRDASQTTRSQGILMKRFCLIGVSFHASLAHCATIWN